MQLQHAVCCPRHASQLRQSRKPAYPCSPRPLQVNYTVDGASDDESGSEFDSDCTELGYDSDKGGPSSRHRGSLTEVDPERVEELRRRAEAQGAKRSAARDADPAARGPKDSGKGVRMQGGRMYDSALGVTCHWCRQKTLECKVTCTNPDCGGGRRMPNSFCKMCLHNRHGEDGAAAAASGCWVCPSCRGTCGAGCRSCCNCGPCRKKVGSAILEGLLTCLPVRTEQSSRSREVSCPAASCFQPLLRIALSNGTQPLRTMCPRRSPKLCACAAAQVGLQPTGQIVEQAKKAGFGNAHDYLVHLVTNETREQISDRKLHQPWGRFLSGDAPEAAAQPQAQPAASEPLSSRESTPVPEAVTPPVKAKAGPSAAGVPARSAKKTAAASQAAATPSPVKRPPSQPAPPARPSKRTKAKTGSFEAPEAPAPAQGGWQQADFAPPCRAVRGGGSRQRKMVSLVAGR